MPPKGRKKFALIWWIKCQKIDVIELSLIPKKDQRVDNITSLNWINPDTTKKEKYQIKILKIGFKEDLEKETVTTDGELHDPSRKIFPANVLSNEKNLAKNKKLLVSQKNANKRRTDLKIKTNEAIFNDLKNISQRSQSSSEGLQFIQPSFTSYCNANSQPGSSNVFINSSRPAVQLPPALSGNNSNFNNSKLIQNIPKSLNKDSSPIVIQSTLDSKNVEKKPSNQQHSLDISEDKENTPSGGSDEDILSHDDDSVGNKEIFSRIELGKVTQRDIYFQEQLLKAMKRKHTSQMKTDVHSDERIPVAQHYFEKGESNDKVELSPNSGIYLSRSRASIIEITATKKNDWRSMVKETLLEIYGSSIANYSAKGLRGEYPAIDFDVFKGLFEWVNRKFDNKVTNKEYTKYINKVAENKRNYKAKKLLGLKSKSIIKINVSDSKYRATKHHSHTVTSLENNKAINFPEINNQRVSKEIQGNVIINESDSTIVQAKLPSGSEHSSRCQLTLSPVDYSTRQAESSDGSHSVTPISPPLSTPNEYQENSKTNQRHSLVNQTIPLNNPHNNISKQIPMNYYGWVGSHHEKMQDSSTRLPANFGWAQSSDEPHAPSGNINWETSPTQFSSAIRTKQPPNADNTNEFYSSTYPNPSLTFSGELNDFSRYTNPYYSLNPYETPDNFQNYHNSKMNTDEHISDCESQSSTKSDDRINHLTPL